ncbi:MAG: YraN family protein [Rickettsiales bacterium]|jgi:putative endonuclease|nr:YraN family protein [Rickettsiales bacterium]
MNNYRYGWFAEFWMSLVLILKGYRILARRYKTYLGEIDMIVKKKNVITIFEIKARRKGDLTTELVGKQQRTRIENAAKIFLAQNRVYVDYNILFGIILFRNIFKFEIFSEIG